MGNQVLKYRRARVDIFFTGDICCDFCPLMETYARKQCRRTGEYLIDTRARGIFCPLTEIEEEHEEIQTIRGK